jgi:hypothetical protein
MEYSSAHEVVFYSGRNMQNMMTSEGIPAKYYCPLKKKTLLVLVSPCDLKPQTTFWKVDFACKSCIGRKCTSQIEKSIWCLG